MVKLYSLKDLIAERNIEYIGVKILVGIAEDDSIAYCRIAFVKEIREVVFEFQLNSMGSLQTHKQRVVQARGAIAEPNIKLVSLFLIHKLFLLVIERQLQLIPSKQEGPAHVTQFDGQRYTQRIGAHLIPV